VIFSFFPLAFFFSSKKTGPPSPPTAGCDRTILLPSRHGARDRKVSVLPASPLTVERSISSFSSSIGSPPLLQSRRWATVLS